MAPFAGSASINAREDMRLQDVLLGDAAPGFLDAFKKDISTSSLTGPPRNAIDFCLQRIQTTADIEHALAGIDLALELAKGKMSKKTLEKAIQSSDNWVLEKARRAVRKKTIDDFHTDFAEFYRALRTHPPTNIHTLSNAEDQWDREARALSDGLVQVASTLRKAVRLDKDARQALKMAPAMITGTPPAFMDYASEVYTPLMISGALSTLDRQALRDFRSTLKEMQGRCTRLDKNLNTLLAQNVMAGPKSFRHQVGPGFTADRWVGIDPRFRGKPAEIQKRALRQRNLDRLIKHAVDCTKQSGRARTEIGEDSIRTLRYALLPDMIAPDDIDAESPRLKVLNVIDQLGRKPSEDELTRAWDALSTLGQKRLMAYRNNSAVMQSLATPTSPILFHRTPLSCREEWNRYSKPVAMKCQNTLKKIGKTIGGIFNMVAATPTWLAIGMIAFAVNPDPRPLSMVQSAVGAGFLQMEHRDRIFADAYSQQFMAIELGMVAYLRDRSPPLDVPSGTIRDQLNYPLFTYDPLYAALQQAAPDFWKGLPVMNNDHALDHRIIDPASFRHYLSSLPRDEMQDVLDRLVTTLAPVMYSTDPLLLAMTECQQTCTADQTPPARDQFDLFAVTATHVLTGINLRELGVIAPESPEFMAP